MRLSKLVALFAFALPALLAQACLQKGTCLRNSDCPAEDICSVGACILAPVDSEGGVVDEGGVEGGTATDAPAATPPDASPAKDATVEAAADSGSEANADAADDGAADADDSGFVDFDF